jgi:DNA repair exonuclease SbcCD ATPase subunit
MNNNLKDLINKAEQEERTHSELQKTIDKLSLEIASLRKKLNEQEIKSKTLLKEKPFQQEESEEIESLKKIITSQKVQLGEKELQNKQLQLNLSNLKSEIESQKSSMVSSPDSQILLDTKQALENILEDYGRVEKENINLTQNVKELEKKNINLTENLQKLGKLETRSQQFEQNYNILKAKSDQLVGHNKLLNEEINSLKSEITSMLSYKQKFNDLTSQINQKSSQNRRLQETIIQLRTDNIRLKRYETMVSTLEAEVKNLQQQKDHIKEQDSILLAKTITAINAQEKSKKEQERATKPKPPGKIEEIKINEPILFSKSEKVSELKTSNQIDIKAPNEKIELPEPQKSVQDLIAEEISDGNNSEVIKRKWECPKCGNIDKSKIREIPDKSHIIYGSLYAKKYKCGLCANEWR